MTSRPRLPGRFHSNSHNFWALFTLDHQCLAEARRMVRPRRRLILFLLLLWIIFQNCQYFLTFPVFFDKKKLVSFYIKISIFIFLGGGIDESTGNSTRIRGNRGNHDGRFHQTSWQERDTPSGQSIAPAQKFSIRIPKYLSDSLGDTDEAYGACSQ